VPAVFGLGLGNSLDLGAFLLPGAVSWAIAIWAVYFCFTEKYSISFLLLGLASLFHQNIGLIMYGIFIFMLIFKKGMFKRKIISLLKSAYFFIGFSISCVPLLSHLNADIDPAKIIYILAKFRAPWHYSPFTWDLIVWVSFIALFIPFLIAFKYSKIDKKYKDIFKLFIIAIFICYLLGTIFVDIIPIESFVKLRLFRASEFLNIIEFIFISEFIYNLILKINNKLKYLIILMGALIFLNLLVLSFFFMPYLFNKIIDKMPLGILFFGSLLIICSKTKYIRIISAVLLMSFLIVFFFYNPIIPRYRDAEKVSEMFSFIKENTPKDSIFLTSPTMATFRSGAERATVVSFQAFTFGEQGMVEWYDRILDVTKSQDKAYQKGVSFNDIKDNYKTLGKEDILRLKKKYALDYAVFEKPKYLNFTILFENDRFVVYKV